LAKRLLVHLLALLTCSMTIPTCSSWGLSSWFFSSNFKTLEGGKSNSLARASNRWAVRAD
jgi:hypothetical protein